MNEIIIRNEEEIVANGFLEEMKTEVIIEAKEATKVDLVAKRKKDNDLMLSAITIGAGAILAGLLVYRELKKKPKIEISEKIVSREEIAVINEKAANTYPEVQITCTKCKNKKAFSVNHKVKTLEKQLKPFEAILYIKMPYMRI